MNKLAKSRRKAREWAIQYLFSDYVEDECEFSRTRLTRFWQMLEDADEEIVKDLENFPKSKKHAEALIEGICLKIKEIDARIIETAKNWSISRMAVVDRNIMRLAIYEMLFEDKVPLKVSINEALEIAKAYSDTESKRFINGILDRIKQDIEVTKK